MKYKTTTAEFVDKLDATLHPKTTIKTSTLLSGLYQVKMITLETCKFASGRGVGYYIVSL